MEKVLLKIPRKLRLIANKYCFTIPRELVKLSGLELNKTYTIVVIEDAKEEEKQQHH